MRFRRTPLAVTVIAAVSTVLLAVGATSGAAAAQPAGGTVRASVPWDRVGAGWVLTQYASAAPEGGSGPAALYLISPGGTRYQLARWPDWRSAPQLVAWSPDGQRALFQVFSGQGGAEMLTLATGQVNTFVMPGEASPIGFTTPDGLNIVAGQPSGSGTSLARYSLSGRLVKALGYSADGQVLYAPSGTEFVTGSSNGLKLASNSGALVRGLPVPGTSANSCNPVRWWNGPGVLRTAEQCHPAALAGSGQRRTAHGADAEAQRQQRRPGRSRRMAAARRAIPAGRRAMRRAADLQASPWRLDHAGDGAAHHG
jgi:hypothetical protein